MTELKKPRCNRRTFLKMALICFIVGGTANLTGCRSFLEKKDTGGNNFLGMTPRVLLDELKNEFDSIVIGENVVKMVTIMMLIPQEIQWFLLSVTNSNFITYDEFKNSDKKGLMYISDYVDTEQADLDSYARSIYNVNLEYFKRFLRVEKDEGLVYGYEEKVLIGDFKDIQDMVSVMCDLGMSDAYRMYKEEPEFVDYMFEERGLVGFFSDKGFMRDFGSVEGMEKIDLAIKKYINSMSFFTEYACLGADATDWGDPILK